MCDCVRFSPNAHSLPLAALRELGHPWMGENCLHVHSTSTMHLMAAPFAHHLVTLVKLCQCAKFCVVSSTFLKIRGSPVKKESASVTCRAQSHGARDTTIACPTALRLYLASFRPTGPSRWPAAPTKHGNVQKGCKLVARALHVHLAPQHNFVDSIL